MDNQITFRVVEHAYAFAGGLVGLALFGAGVSFLPAPSSLVITQDCIAGDYEYERMMYATYITTVFLVSSYYIGYYLRLKITKNFGENADMILREKSTKARVVRCLMFIAHTLASLAVFAFFQTLTFIIEVKYKKFNCLSLIFQSTVLATYVLVVFYCVASIWEAYQACFKL